MTIPEYYTTHFSQYHAKTFTVDPASFLSSFVENLKPGAHVLDIGCGSGRDLLWLSQKGFQPTGFEASPGLAALARQNANCPVIEDDFESFDFPTLQADAILMSGALKTFRQVMEDPEFSVICGRGNTDTGDGRAVFAMIQSLSRNRHLENFSPKEFEYIVIDEFHRAEATAGCSPTSGRISSWG